MIFGYRSELPIKLGKESELLAMLVFGAQSFIDISRELARAYEPSRLLELAFVDRYRNFDSRHGYYPTSSKKKASRLA